MVTNWAAQLQYVSAQQPVEHVKNTLQNITTERSPHSACSRFWQGQAPIPITDIRHLTLQGYFSPQRLRGLPYMMSAKFSDFFTPPPCHCRKSADFVPIVCFLGTPHPLRTSYMEAPSDELCNLVFDSPPWSLRGLIDVDRQWECHIGIGASLIWTTTTEKRSPY